MLVNELSGNGSLFIGQGVPRAWLANGKRVVVAGAPTHFGPVNLLIESATSTGRITAKVEFTGARRPPTLLLRLRHPDKKSLRSVTVNGAPWDDFDAAKEWVRIPNPSGARYEVVAQY